MLNKERSIQILEARQKHAGSKGNLDLVIILGAGMVMLCGIT